ncbi:unnamed protein product [Lactuca saligna]|uniref:E2 ubiquitin-conjugating enzyme n=1 Tax=Lactuca saligna TaxID=75948 RepID=A0AA35Z4X5_LACSI|nr:unnamed protein product [Lactuca saligna]
MAQAARLNLRMQKEVKLLLTDPPPGASFPHLSPTSDLSSFSLTSIDAQIQGPEDTVYEKGVFKIKIQIPERYPFQPPSVTFATPIYHPNIDTGGRICLDILNLPPKGAWQPSLNISTVLTSIGLLLSEPNPDDGLMCEASKEYKYNKQVFDQKARSMTEKYAKSDTSGSKSNTGVNEEPLNLTPQSLIQEPKQDFKDFPFDHNDQDNIQEPIRSKKLCLSSKNRQQEAMDSTKDSIDGPCFTNPKRKKLGLSGKKQSLGFLSIPQNKENDYNGKKGSFGSNVLKVPQDDNGKPTKLSRKPLQVMEENDNHNHGNSTTSDLKDCGARSEGEGLCDLGEVIVLDSEDSEEETRNTMKSRRLIARKRLLGKY